ncbi:ACP S-malonyltransferase [Pseudoclavibacter endophyticus]|uniref:[acyl-carrier-protein] S-malonyltransferase n=1 Tax=Pseudoclavibacter endophyticus TaxID=1778590 RepID=A0A6H9WHY1_9MICO|nr:ACP S-malonyltransferase [Pseudoclavibacter endophyticus]KAB1650552.1 ACP S-malonyltransferase [Pseudoclavibacter endophyticus]GGA58189.1 ACP S-malonyltransferase [Pseudoclavibacter endophyticus]
MLVLTCPGQGAQKPGFLAPWLEDAAHRTLLEQLSDAAGVDLVRHGTESDAETIRDTAIAQPLIVAAGILTWNALTSDDDADESGGFAARIGGVAGHSVGEVTAAYCAGIFDAETAIRFVATRAELMAADAATVRTGMSAVLGGDQAEIEATLEGLDLTPANYNGGGQIVAAGLPERLDELASTPPARARVVPLQVAGAFHTPFMATARAALADQRNAFQTGDPVRTIWTNRDGSMVTSGAEFVDAMIEQVARPVRWDACMASFADAGVSGLVEVAPGGTLVGLSKRGLRGTPAVAITTPADLDTARELVAA